MGLTTVTIQAIDDNADPLDSVEVNIYTQEGALVTSVITGELTPGEVQLLLEGSDPAVVYTCMLFKEGYSFPPINSIDISVEDPPLGTNTFEFAAVEGLVDELVTFSVSGNGEPLPDTKVSVFDALDSFITSVMTGGSGDVAIVLPGSAGDGMTYVIRLIKDNWVFDLGATQTIAVISDDTNVFDLEASKPLVPVAADPLMCRVTGTIANMSFQPSNAGDIVISQAYTNEHLFSSDSDHPSVLGDTILSGELRVRPDSRGYVDFLLPRNTVLSIKMPGLRNPVVPVNREVHVPDVAGMKLEDLIYPYVKEVTSAETDISIAIDSDPLQVLVTLYSSDEYSGVVYERVEATSSNLEVMTCGINEFGYLVVTPLTVGTAEITFSRVSGISAVRIPSVPDLVAPVIPVSVA